MEERRLRVAILAFLLLTGCRNNDKYNHYVSFNNSQICQIHSTLSDSIRTYLKSYLLITKSIMNQDWAVDSFICINSKKDKLVATINNSNGIGEVGTSDAVGKILGKKINNHWYFFEGGGTLIVPRDMYGKDKNHPLSMHELSQIAHKEMFGENCLIKKDGEYIVNDAWVDQHFYDKGWGNFKRKEQYDSVHWFYIIDKWNHKFDPKEFEKEKLQ